MSKVHGLTEKLHDIFGKEQGACGVSCWDRGWMFVTSLTASSAVRSPAEKDSQAVMMSILIECGGPPKDHEATDPDKHSVFLESYGGAQCSQLPLVIPSCSKPGLWEERL